VNGEVDKENESGLSEKALFFLSLEYFFFWHILTSLEKQRENQKKEKKTNIFVFPTKNEINHFAIWGSHSVTMCPDLSDTLCHGVRTSELKIILFFTLLLFVCF